MHPNGSPTSPAWFWHQREEPHPVPSPELDSEGDQIRQFQATQAPSWPKGKWSLASLCSLVVTDPRNGILRAPLLPQTDTRSTSF